MGFRLFLVLSLLLIGCKAELIHNVSEWEASRLVSLLQSNGVIAEKEIDEKGAWMITVDKSDEIAAFNIIGPQRFPRETETHEEDSNTSLIPSKEGERFRYERSVSKVLERTLLAIPGVREAKVQMSLPSQPFFSSLDKIQEGSSSAFLVVGEEFGNKKEDIQTLISGATGLTQQRVTVLLSTEPQHTRSLSIPGKKSYSVPHERWIFGTLGIGIIGYAITLKKRKTARLYLPDDI